MYTYVIVKNILLFTFTSGLRQVSGISPGISVSYNNITDRHEITEIVLSVELNTIALTLTLKRKEDNDLIVMIYTCR